MSYLDAVQIEVEARIEGLDLLPNTEVVASQVSKTDLPQGLSRLDQHDAILG